LYQTGAAAALRKTFAERLVAVVSDPLKIEYKRKEEARLKVYFFVLPGCAYAEQFFFFFPYLLFSTLLSPSP